MGYWKTLDTRQVKLAIIEPETENAINIDKSNYNNVVSGAMYNPVPGHVFYTLSVQNYPGSYLITLNGTGGEVSSVATSFTSGVQFLQYDKNGNLYGIETQYDNILFYNINPTVSQILPPIS